MITLHNASIQLFIRDTHTESTVTTTPAGRRIGIIKGRSRTVNGGPVHGALAIATTTESTYDNDDGYQEFLFPRNEFDRHTTSRQIMDRVGNGTLIMIVS